MAARYLLVFGALLAAGCSKDESRSETPCDYAAPACALGQVCAFAAPGRSTCAPFVTHEAELGAPFRADQPFSCFQGARSAIGRTHSFRGDIFALALQSSPSGPAAEIVAPVDGDAFVFDECEERETGPDARNSSQCGLGYGNHVKIWAVRPGRAPG